MKRGFREIWGYELTPFILDAFTLHLWATPFAIRLLDTVGTTIYWYIGTVMAIATLTFVASLVPNIHLGWLHTEVGVCESPLFRSAWLFTAMATVTRHTGGAGILPFTLVAFLPLVYVRISPRLPPVTALYATGFFICTILVAFARHTYQDTTGHPAYATDTSFNVVSTISEFISFTISCVHHSLWITSHKHAESIPTPEYHTTHQGMSDPQTDPNTPLLKSTFRTLVVLLSMLVRETPTYSANYLTLCFIQTLFLLATISTLAAWTHGQHKQPTSLSNILLATVVASSCGMLVDSTRQTACLLAATPFAIAIELRNRSVLGSKPES